MKSPLFLSPMAGYTTLPFRVAIRSLGGLSIATTDLVNARSLLEMNPKGIRMVSTCSQDRPLGVQLFGSKTQELCDAAKFLEDLGIDLIDLNMGCPVDKITRQGGGAALMQDEELTEELVGAIVRSVHLPVTVKMRLGWNDDTINAHRIAPRLEEMGVAAIAIHGRTREQGFSGNVNLEGIKAVVDSVKSIPIIGNGDVHSPKDANRMLNEMGCKGVMVGRAALANPFFFKQTLHYLTRGELIPEPTLEQRIMFMHKHFALALKYYGEMDACLHFRKMLTGYSEHFPKKEVWRRETQTLSTAEEYLAIVKKLTDGAVSKSCSMPNLQSLI